MQVLLPPQIVDEITPEWITFALREGRAIREAVVRSVKLTPIGEGVGFLSGVAVVRLEYDRQEPGAPASVVVKLPSAAQLNRETGESFHAYEREALFYQMVAPTSPIRLAHCWYSYVDVPADRFALVFEDGSALRAGD